MGQGDLEVLVPFGAFRFVGEDARASHVGSTEADLDVRAYDALAAGLDDFQIKVSVNVQVHNLV